VLCALVLIATLKPIAFEIEPIGAEVLRGERTFLGGKGLPAVLAEDRQAVGIWFDGRARREVEDVIWVSPGLVSRWLGYLRAKEKWPDGELQSRWDKLRPVLDGRITFIVRLAALPRQDPLDFGWTGAPGVRDARELRFMLAHLPPGGGHPRGTLTFGVHPESALEPRRLQAPGVALLAWLQSRQWRDVVTQPWHLYVPFGGPLMGEFERVPSAWERLPLGDNFGAMYLLQAETPATLYGAGTLEVRVFSPSKERVARFALVGGK
jgi:hypothetical protein